MPRVAQDNSRVYNFFFFFLKFTQIYVLDVIFMISQIYLILNTPNEVRFFMLLINQ